MQTTFDRAVSEADFHNLATLRRAAHNNALMVVVSRLAENKQPVALVCAGNVLGDEIKMVPFGILFGENNVDAQDKLTEIARSRARRLEKALRSTRTNLRLMNTEGQTRVTDGIKRRKTSAAADPLMILAWDNPYELFEDPIA